MAAQGCPRCPWWVHSAREAQQGLPHPLPKGLGHRAHGGWPPRCHMPALSLPGLNSASVSPREGAILPGSSQSGSGLDTLPQPPLPVLGLRNVLRSKGQKDWFSGKFCYCVRIQNKSFSA